MLNVCGGSLKEDADLSPCGIVAERLIVGVGDGIIG